MRKLLVYINSTLNGVVTGDPSQDKTNFMVWTSQAFMEAGSECALKTMETVDTLLLGRRTYEDLSKPDKWPSVKEWPDVSGLSLALGEKINNIHKWVVSHDHPLDALTWGDYEAPKPLTGPDVEKQIRALKNREGGDIVIFGSPTLVRSLTDADLIDEYQIQIRPVVVTVGEHLFDELSARKDFDLIEATPLKEGSIFVKYKPVKTLSSN
ncbi:dihydrofolate reductase family protein [Spirosoma sp. BT702]|uniref:Dihydrofolate reductase family protein n=1 Tax=Spirosoma profusum TaxID=2771354 RepID=A0A927AUV6_9BACT|nr:dihydrofolate reductase family protein [Spirosoma profusum]MBD2704839.1 dihydrofolate reductase family protein [Spirosoma profusum]